MKKNELDQGHNTYTKRKRSNVKRMVW